MKCEICGGTIDDLRLVRAGSARVWCCVDCWRAVSDPSDAIGRVARAVGRALDAQGETRVCVELDGKTACRFVQAVKVSQEAKVSQEVK